MPPITQQLLISTVITCTLVYFKIEGRVVEYCPLVTYESFLEKVTLLPNASDLQSCKICYSYRFVLFLFCSLLFCFTYPGGIPA